MDASGSGRDKPLGKRTVHVQEQRVTKNEAKHASQTEKQVRRKRENIHQIRERNRTTLHIARQEIEVGKDPPERRTERRRKKRFDPQQRKEKDRLIPKARGETLSSQIKLQ